jgi:hypothetical protein
MVKLLGERAESAEAIMETAFTLIGGSSSKPIRKNTAPSSL